jgi:serine/threonine protein kinase
VTRYELLDRIGVGGMAEIFRGKAVAAGGFEKPVAIKRILPHLSQDQRFVELLIAEAKVLSLLKHRNIVQIFDVGLGDDQQYFLVMEFVDGKDIGAIQRALEARRRRIPFDLVLHIGAEICEALEHAHTARAPDGKSMSLVHRDVSPSNVLLSRAGEVKLTDFGIAKRAEQDPTQAGAVRGKFAYISPEQAKNEHLDPRSDVFSVGILIWELCCNRRLFSQLDDLAALRAVREAKVPRPSEVDSRLPPEIDSILMQALSRDKIGRFPSAGALGQKLRSLRYSLEVTVGDPATELAKIIESTEEVERESKQSIPRASGMFGEENTVIRIHTADAFSARDNDASIVKARAVIDRFEEEETRLAQLTGDQLQMLRGGSAPQRDSNEMTAASMPPVARQPRARRDSDEATRARAPLDLEEPSISETPPGATPPHGGFGADEATRLVAPRDRRTPQPQRIPRPGTSPPPMPRGGTAASRTRPPTPSPAQQMPMQQMPMQQMPMQQMPMQQMPAPVPPSGENTVQFQPMPNMPPGAQPFQGGWGPPIAAQMPPRDATPTSQDAFDRPVFPSRPSQLQVAGFGRPKKTALKPWMLVVGAVIMATLAFVITRMFIR